jgi:hypothetical protein
MLPLSICLDRPSLYNVATTLFCYRLLLPLYSEESKIYWNESFKTNSFVARTENAHFPTGYSFVPDINNKTSIEMACSGLTKADCERWVSCSRAAQDCCKRHATTNLSVPGYYCTAVWDGVSCVDYTSNGTEVPVECPAFYVPGAGKGVLHF